MKYIIVDTGSVNSSGEKIFYIALENGTPITEPLGKSAFKTAYRTQLSALATEIFRL